MRVTSNPKKQSPLEALASSFHQDFGVMGVVPTQWGKDFARALSPSARRTLDVELKALMDAHPGASNKGILNAWRRRGAAYWPRSHSLRESIVIWLDHLA